MVCWGAGRRGKLWSALGGLEKAAVSSVCVWRGLGNSSGLTLLPCPLHSASGAKMGLSPASLIRWQRPGAEVWALAQGGGGFPPSPSALGSLPQIVTANFFSFFLSFSIFPGSLLKTRSSNTPRDVVLMAGFQAQARR